MPRIDVAFILLAALCMIAGVGLGIGMGIAHDFALAPVHAHINLVGWTSLALYGVIYGLYPALGRSRLALPHLALAGVSAVAFPVGIWLSIAHGTPGLAIAASLAWLAGALLFLANLVRTLVLTARAPKSEHPALA